MALHFSATPWLQWQATAAQAAAANKSSQGYCKSPRNFLRPKCWTLGWLGPGMDCHPMHCKISQFSGESFANTLAVHTIVMVPWYMTAYPCLICWRS